MTLKLTSEQARELTYMAPGDTDQELGLTVELDEQTGSRRWVSEHRIIVRDKDGRLWAASYERGLIECQECRPFEDQAEVEFREVEKVPVTAYEYRPKPDAP